MNAAQKLVELLLNEREFVCALCQREAGHQPGPEQSHLYCRRHYVNHLTNDKFMPPPRAEQEANRYGKFAPDLRQAHRPVMQARQMAPA